MGTGTDVAIEARTSCSSGATCAASLKARAQRVHAAQHQPEPVLRVRLQSLGVPPRQRLYPWLHLLLSPMVASAAMSVSSVSVIANAPPARFTLS